MYQIIEQTAIYTGGNIYLFYGKLRNGNYYIATSDFDVRIVSQNPLEYDKYDFFVSDNVEWQEQYLVEDLSENDARLFCKDLIKRIITIGCNFSGISNYLISDIEHIYSEEF